MSEPIADRPEDAPPYSPAVSMERARSLVEKIKRDARSRHWTDRKLRRDSR